MNKPARSNNIAPIVPADRLPERSDRWPIAILFYMAVVTAIWVGLLVFGLLYIVRF